MWLSGPLVPRPRQNQCDASHGGEAQLEGDLKQGLRVQPGHHCCRQQYGGQVAAWPADGHGTQVDGGHDRGPLHRWAHACQGGVNPHRCQWDEQVYLASPPYRKCAGSESEKQDDAHMEPRHCQQVRRATGAEVLPYFLGQGIALAQQQGLGQGGLRLWQDSVKT